jgi:hypothetical protein
MYIIKRKSILRFLLLTSSLLISCSTTQTAVEKAQKALRIEQKIQSSHFTFKAEYAHPISFQPIFLTTPYDLKVSKDTVQAYLPYFGRAYVAPMDPAQGGIEFTCTQFDYNVIKGKHHGNWIVTIKTSLPDRSLSLNINIWENGSARLTVEDPNRQSISFEGNIEDAK